MAPRVVSGSRVSDSRPIKPRSKTKKHKDRPPVGKGNYVKAPLLRDKATKPRWLANAVINNPGTAAAGLGLGGGSLVLIDKRDKKSKKETRKEMAAGAAAGGGGAHIARQGLDYKTKRVAEAQFKRLTTKGNYGPYAEGPHKATLNRYKREAHKASGGDVRRKAKYFDENFPKGVPSRSARKMGALLNKKPVVAGTALGGAALGSVGAERVKKSAFGVLHEEY